MSGQAFDDKKDSVFAPPKAQEATDYSSLGPGVNGGLEVLEQGVDFNAMKDMIAAGGMISDVQLQALKIKAGESPELAEAIARAEQKNKDKTVV